MKQYIFCMLIFALYISGCTEPHHVQTPKNIPNATKTKIVNSKSDQDIESIYAQFTYSKTDQERKRLLTKLDQLPKSKTDKAQYWTTKFLIELKLNQLEDSLYSLEELNKISQTGANKLLLCALKEKSKSSTSDEIFQCYKQSTKLFFKEGNQTEILFPKYLSGDLSKEDLEKIESNPDMVKSTIASFILNQEREKIVDTLLSK